MLGSVSEAEDVVSDAFLRLAQAGQKPIESPKAYLATITTRLAIDQLRSARARRESYAGPWLPEPLLTGGPGDLSADVAAAAEMSDSLSMAFLGVLETLTPPARAGRAAAVRGVPRATGPARRAVLRSVPGPGHAEPGRHARRGRGPLR